MGRLAGKTVLIVGGTSGIGLSTGLLAKAEGARVVVVGRDAAKAYVAADALGEGAEVEVMDGGDRAELDSVVLRLKTVHHLVLAASGGRGAGRFASLAETELQAGFDAKFWVQWRAAQVALHALAKDGSITFVTAASARLGTPGTSGLAAINGAINAMVLPLARELAPIRVNAVSPGVIDTPWWANHTPGQKEALFRHASAASPVGRVGKPEEVAQAILFLMTNGFMTGVILDVDGGMRAGPA
jgi:NAD(P)-dependent dehydrogenase (short-subunit alcohol dehydrogenase family)